MSKLAFQRDPPANQFRQLAAQMQPQPASLVTDLLRTFYLAERLKEPRLIFHANADTGIDDAEFHRSLAPAQFQRDGALLRELDRIVRQVEEDLVNGSAIAIEYDFVWRIHR